MAIFPCDFSYHRYPGAQRSVYVTSIWGDDTETTKLRMCDKHLVEYIARAQTYMAIVDDNSAVSKTCERCPGDRVGAVYAKVFPPKADPYYLAVDVCAACWQQVREVLLVANGRGMTAL